MHNELIGRISLSPRTVAPGQSVRVAVTGPNGEDYPIAGDIRVRINGVPGARQYLQFDAPGDAIIQVTAERDGKVETASAAVHVTGADAPTPALDSDGLRILDLIHHPCLGAPPVLRVARS